MLKYTNTEIVFQEFPDEITLAFNISGCPVHCKGCHSKWLWEDTGTALTIPNINKEIKLHEGITCIGFMGGDNDRDLLNAILIILKHEYPELKLGWYTGLNNYNQINLNYLDYVKVGPYIKELGGLNNRNTNQRIYKIIHNNKDNSDINKNYLVDITERFWNRV